MRLELLPDEFLISVANRLPSRKDVVNLLLTCWGTHRAATEVYAKLRRPKSETIKTLKSIIDDKYYMYSVESPWKAYYVANVLLDFPDTRFADDWIAQIQERASSEGAMNSITASELQHLQRCQVRSQDLHDQSSEIAPVHTVLGLFTGMQSLCLKGLGPSTMRTKMTWSGLERSVTKVARNVTVLSLSKCHITSGHVRQLLTIFPSVKRLQILGCEVVDGWDSLLCQVYLHRTGIQYVNASMSYDQGFSLLPADETVFRGRMLQTCYRSVETCRVTPRSLEAMGNLAIQVALEKVLKGWLGEGQFEVAMRTGEEERKRDEEAAKIFK